jgi:hypothetical protein
MPVGRRPQFLAVCSCHMDLFIDLLMYTHVVAAGFPQRECSQRVRRKPPFFF